MSAEVLHNSSAGERFVALLIGLLGLGMAFPGAYLFSLGGSLYYLLAGIAMLASAVLIWRGRSAGSWLYGLICLATVVWALVEAGLDGWALLPRLNIVLALGFGLLILRTWRNPYRGLHRMNATLIGLLVLGLVFALWSARGPARTDDAAQPIPGLASTQWQVLGGPDASNQRFSPLGQITPQNVSALKVAWTTHIGKGGPTGGVLEGTPIKVGDTLYACDMGNRIHALDPETGASRWMFTPSDANANPRPAVCRGVTYARIEGATLGGLCAERIFIATSTAKIYGVDARNGKLCASFGNKGVINTLEGLSPAPKGYYFHTSPPVLVRGKLVVGANSLDGQSVKEPSGVIRAYDARTGLLSWAWDIGRPDRTGLPPKGEYYTPGTPNSWPPMAADEKNGLVFVPTGNATPDYVMSHRTPAMNKYSSSVVALDAQTGQMRWAFQTTHLDQWDYDVASPPTLIDYPVKGGRTVQALVQATKRGQTFILDRMTGKPLVPVTERKVPTDGVPGETFSPTQPYSGLPSMFGEELSEKKMWGMTPFDQLWCRIKFKQARYDGEFTPIMSDRSSVIYPSYIGGSNWSGVAYDPSRQLLAINVNHFPMYNRLVSRKEARRLGIQRYVPGKNELDIIYWAQEGTPWAMENKKFMGPLGAPCNEPPFGTMGVVDLKTGKFVWHKPLGKARDIGPFGLALGLPFTIGTPQLGGALLTGTGLIFIGGTQEKTFRALDTNTGEVLWEDRLPAGAHANPMTYYSNKTGQQFVVVGASGHYQFGNGHSDMLVAYALPAIRMNPRLKP